MWTQNQITWSFAITATAFILAGPPAQAQDICPTTELTSSLERPIGIALSNQGNLLVSESGSFAPNTGRISLVDVNGTRKTFLEGLPSGISDVGDPSGPSGLFMRGRTLFLAIGSGDTVFAGAVPNPRPSSPLFSSVLAIHFGADVEKEAVEGFSLTPADTAALAGGKKVTLSNHGNRTVTVEVVANFPDYTVDPASLSGFRNVNPFALVAVGDQLFVTDGGQNLIWQVDVPTGTFSVLTTFPRIPNPLPGPPLVEAVPTGIAYTEGQLLVALFRGFPFPVGASVVEQVDPETGAHAPIITGLKAPIAILPTGRGNASSYLVLQHASQPGPPPSPASQPGLLLRFTTPGASPEVLANCLTRPTAMALDAKTDTLYVTEYTTGRLVAIPIP